MLFSEPPKNKRQVMAALDKLARRKGKPVQVSNLASGDILRAKDNRYSLLVLEIAGLGFTVWPASTLYSTRIAIGSCGKLADLKDSHFEDYVLIGRKEDYPEPEHVPQIKTFYQVNSDGSVCGQNLIYGMRGQHFRVSLEKWAEIAADAERECIALDGPCPACELAPGQCREYDGHTWQLEA